MGRVGRPAERESAKLAPLNMRTSPQLRAQIERAADDNGRSLTQEVERRLMTSFIFDEARGGQHINAFTAMLAATIQRLELRYGKKWIEDAETFSAVKAATLRLLDWDSPRIDPGPAYHQFRDARARREEAQAALERFRERTGAVTPIAALIAAGSGKPVTGAQGSPEDQAQAAELERAVSDALAVEIAAADRFEAGNRDLFERVDAARAVGTSTATITFEEIGPTRKGNGA